MAQSKRNSFIDLWRFIAMLMIMAHHQYRLGLSDYYGYFGWVFVEFFFILTGYLTARHFSRTTCEGLEGACKNALSYTRRKFLPLVPFAAIAILLEYGLQLVLKFIAGPVGLQDLISLFSSLPFELMLVSSSYTSPLLVPLWYLSAMFLVFPLFCILVQRMGKYTRLVFSLLIPILFYGAHSVVDNWLFPLNIARSFSAMMLGVFAYEVATILQSMTFAKWGKLLLNVLLTACFICPLIICYFGFSWLLRFVVLCFVAGVTLLMSGHCYPSRIQSTVLEYLGKISMPMYLFHWVIAGVIHALSLPLQKDLKVALYYISALLVSICAYEIHRCIMRCISKKSAKATEPVAGVSA